MGCDTAKLWPDTAKLRADTARPHRQLGGVATKSQPTVVKQFASKMKATPPAFSPPGVSPPSSIERARARATDFARANRLFKYSYANPLFPVILSQVVSDSAGEFRFTR
jgi:hypothetical protein